MAAPISRAACGVPVTVTASLNSTVTSIASPARKTPFAPRGAGAAPASASPATVGATASAAEPSTLKSAWSVIAWLPKPSAAAFGFVAASTMDPPFSVSAAAHTLIPSGSAAAASTV